MPDDCDDKLPASRKESLPESTEKSTLQRFYSRAKGIARDLTDKAPYVGKALDAYDALKTGKEIYDAVEGEREKAIAEHKEPPSFLDAAISKASEVIKNRIKDDEQKLTDAFLKNNPYYTSEIDIPKEELSRNSRLQQRMIESLNALEFSRKNPDASLDTATEFKAEIARIGVAKGWQKAATFGSDYTTIGKLVMSGHGDPDQLVDILNKHSLYESRYDLKKEIGGYGRDTVKEFFENSYNSEKGRDFVREKSYLEPTRLDKTGWAHERHDIPDTNSLHTTSQEIIRGVFGNSGCGDNSPSKDIEPDR